MRSRTYQTYQLLRDALLTCRYAPGSKLRILDLCEKFDVSQSAIREALARLTSEGLLESEEQRGFRVKSISIAELRTLSVARSEIEALCLRNAVPRGDSLWQARVTAAFEAVFATAPDDAANPGYLSEAFLAAHKELLNALVSACDNPWLLELRATLTTQSMRYSAVGKTIGTDLLPECRRMQKLALARDVDGLVAEVKQTMIDTAERMVVELQRAGMSA